MTDINDLIQNRYDAFVLDSGGAVATSETKLGIELEVAVALEKEERDYLAEARLRIDKVIQGSRKVRRSHVKRNIDTILTASLPEDAEYIDPLLDMAFPLGDAAGLDKALRFWTAEDFDGLVATVYRTAGEVLAAATELDTTVQAVKVRMAAAGADVFGLAVADNRQKASA